MTAILGLNVFHADSAVCLLVDGRLDGAVAEVHLGPRSERSSGFVERVAALIAAGKVLGETINAKIKRRERFRPHAPSVLQEDVASYF